MHRFIIVIFHHYSKWFHDHSHPLPYGPQLFAWLVSGGRGSHSIDPWQVPRSSRSSRAGNDSCRSHGVHCVLRALAGGTLQHNGVGAVKQLDSWHGGSMVQSAVFIHNRLRVLCNSLCFCWTKILVMFGLRSWALGIQILLASSIHKPTLTTVESQPPKRYRKNTSSPLSWKIYQLLPYWDCQTHHFMPSTGVSRIVTGRHLLATPCGRRAPCGPRARLLDRAARRSSNGRCSWCRAGKAEATCDGHLDDLGQWVWVRTDYFLLLPYD